MVTVTPTSVIATTLGSPRHGGRLPPQPEDYNSTVFDVEALVRRIPYFATEASDQKYFPSARIPASMFVTITGNQSWNHGLLPSPFTFDALDQNTIATLRRFCQRYRDVK
ncbi:uncharacterized protein CCR75_000116 [Bremia lactucae]|uniref:Uncharacterized protein n=1 Tax=Bremia lactucae TaxID=4779 RepID=A0A976IIN5_BRELC|nr:hypothetical protein CCR75_000116 [Bremia lactucae]